VLSQRFVIYNVSNLCMHLLEQYIVQHYALIVKTLKVLARSDEFIEDHLWTGGALKKLPYTSAPSTPDRKGKSKAVEEDEFDALASPSKKRRVQ
jgi:hypothetical protein